MDKEEQKGYDDSNFSSSEKDLDEEVLNDQNNIEKYEHYKRDVGWNIFQLSRKYKCAKDVNDQVNHEISEEPAEVIL